MRTATLFLTLFIAIGCSHPPHATTRRLDRAQKRSMQDEYHTLLTSAQKNILDDGAARTSAHAQKNAVQLAAQVSQVETSKALYTAIGLSQRQSRRMDVMLAKQKKKASDTKANPTTVTRSAKLL